MNESSKPTTVSVPTNKSWLDQATRQLTTAKVPTAALDASLLLAHVYAQSRTWLIAHQNDNIIDLNVLENASKALEKRLNRIPLAYITNHKEFYNRSFFVNESVLIPRPESETIIELLKELPLSDNPGLLDLGTGSGALGITAKLEIPALSVTLSDISEDALTVARKNAGIFGAKPLRYVQSDLLSHWLSHEKPKKFDIIIANLPYVDHTWQRSPETDHEPALALFAKDHGLELIKKCIQQARQILSVNGYLLVEADPEQHEEIITFANGNFAHVETRDYIVVLEKK